MFYPGTIRAASKIFGFYFTIVFFSLLASICIARALDSPLDHPVGIAAARDGRLYVLQQAKDHLIVFDRSGGMIDRYSLPQLGENLITCAAPPSGDRIYVLGPQHIWCISLAGSIISQFAHGLDSPIDLAVDAQGNIFLLDGKTRSVVVFERDGRRRTTFGLGESATCLGIDGESRILIGNPEKYRVDVLIYDSPKRSIERTGNSPWLLGTVDIAVNGKGQILTLGKLDYYGQAGALRLLDKDFYPIASFGGFSIGGISPCGALAVGPDDSVYVLDSQKRRICILPPDISEPEPSFTPNPTGCIVTWHACGKNAELHWAEDSRGETGPAWSRAGASSSGNRHQVILRGLKPSTRYICRFSPSVTCIPDAGLSREYRFMTAPLDGRMQLLELDVIAAIYLKTEIDGRPFELPAEKLGDRIRREFDKARLFFLRNSHFRLHIRVDYVVLEGKTGKVTKGWIDPAQVRSDLKEALAAQGRSLDAYESIVAVYAEPGYEKRGDEPAGSVGGGGLTPFGYSVFGMGGSLSWLFLHEYHHQIDAFFERSDLPEYWLNHPDPTIHQGRYGQHWDCNAYILRHWPISAWLACVFGKVIETDDRDRDGIPDEDARLALDEVRFGSSRLIRDTDSDGLTDLEEAMAGIYSGSDPTRADTDRDGLADGEDQYPLYAISPPRERKTPTIDGSIAPGEWQELYTETGSPGRKTYLNWSEGFLYFAVDSPEPVQFKLDIDPDNDGYFNGLLLSVEVLALDPEKPCEVKGPEGTIAVAEKSDGHIVIEVKVPCMRRGGRPIGAGDRFGIDVSFGEHHLFEPWTLVALECAEAPR